MGFFGGQRWNQETLKNIGKQAISDVLGSCRNRPEIAFVKPGSRVQIPEAAFWQLITSNLDIFNSVVRGSWRTRFAQSSFPFLQVGVCLNDAVATAESVG
jgi:hypothetical protein